MSNVGDLFADIPNFFDANGLHPTSAPPTTHDASADATTTTTTTTTTTATVKTTPSSPNATPAPHDNTTHTGGGSAATELLGFDMPNSASMTIPTAEYMAMQTKLSEQAVELAKQTRDIRNLKKNMSSLKERVMATSTIKKKLDEYNSNLAQMTREKEQAFQEKTLAVQEKMQAIQEKTQLQTENARLAQAQQQLNAQLAETDPIKQELAAAKREIAKANSRANAKQQEVTETKGLLMKTRAEQDNLKRTLASQQAEIERLKQELHTAQAQQVEGLSQADRIEDLQSQLDDQSTVYEIERSAWEAKAEMAAKNEHLARQEAGLAKDDAAKAKEDAARFQRELALAKADAQRAQQACVQAKSEMERLQKDLAEAQKAATAAAAAKAKKAAVLTEEVAATNVAAVTATSASTTPLMPQWAAASTNVVSQIQDTLAMFAEAGEKLKLLNVLGTAGCFDQARGGDSVTTITTLQKRVAELEKEKAALQDHLTLAVTLAAPRPPMTRRRTSLTSRTTVMVEPVCEDPGWDDPPGVEVERPTSLPSTESTTIAKSTATTTTPTTVAATPSPSSSLTTTTPITPTTTTTTTTTIPPVTPVASVKPVRAKVTRKRKVREPEVDLASLPIRNISQKTPEGHRATLTDTALTPVDSGLTSVTAAAVSSNVASALTALGSPVDRASKRPRTVSAGGGGGAGGVSTGTLLPMASASGKAGSNGLLSPPAGLKSMDALARLVAVMEQPYQQQEQTLLSKRVKEVVQWMGGKADLLTRAILKRAKAIRPLVSQFRQSQQQQQQAPLSAVGRRYLSEEEQQIVALVRGLGAKRPRLYEQVMVGLGKSLIHEMEGGVTVTRLEGMTVVARLVAGLCRETGQVSRMRTIVYEILREHPPASKLAFTLCEHVASVWPLVFQLDDVQEGDDGGAQVMLQTFQAVIKQAYDKHAADIRFFGYSTFVDKCDWPKLEEVPSCKELAEYLMEVASTSVFTSRYTQQELSSTSPSSSSEQALSADFGFQLCKSLELLLTQAYSAAQVQQWFSSTGTAQQGNEGSPSPPSLYRMMLEEERYALAIPLVTRVFGDRRFRKPLLAAKVAAVAEEDEDGKSKVQVDGQQQQQQQTGTTANVSALCELLSKILESTATVPHQITAAMGLLELLSSMSLSLSPSSSSSSSDHVVRFRQLGDWYRGLESESDRQAVPETLRWILASVGVKEAQRVGDVTAAAAGGGGNVAIEETPTLQATETPSKVLTPTDQPLQLPASA